MGDVITFGPKTPRRSSRWWAVALGAALVAIVVVIAFAIVSRGPGNQHQEPGLATSTATAVPPTEPPGAPCVPVGWAQSPAVTDAPAALTIGGTATRPAPTGLTRCDRGAVDGPWTAVVRRVGGSLGRHGAVVTFPVDATTAAPSGAASAASGEPVIGTLVWPIGTAYARIRGDLTDAELTAISVRTTIVAGRPVVDAPAGFTVVFTGPYRPPVIHELRYGSAELGEEATLGNGLTYTGIVSGGGFEDQLYAVQASDAGLVGSARAVLSPVFGGNATLAWEPVPGVVAYVGYSGALLDPQAVAALHRLAARARLLTTEQWQSAQPQTVDQTNDPG